MSKPSSFWIFVKNELSLSWDDTSIVFVICIVSTAIARLINLRLPIPYTLILNIFGLMVGYLKSHHGIVSEIIWEDKSMIFLRGYYSLIIVYVCFTTNIYIFRRNIWQIFIMCLGCHLLQQVSLVFLTDLKLPFGYDLLYFAQVSSISYSLDTTPLMRKRGIPENICALLEGESVIGLGFSLLIIEHLEFSRNTGLSVKFVISCWTIHFFIGLLLGKIYSIASKYIQSDIVVIVMLIISFGSLSIPLHNMIPLTCTLYSLVFGYRIGIDRSILVRESEKTLRQFWTVLFNMIQGIMSVFFGMEGFEFLIRSMPTVSSISLLYVRVIVSRAVSLLLLAPILSRTGYGIKWSEAIFALWVPTSGNVTVFIGYIYGNKYQHLYSLFSRPFIFEIVRQVINGISAPFLIQFLKMTSISRMQQIQMSKSLQYIMNKRKQYFRTLQLNPYYASINWSKMKSFTIISNPYEILYDILMVDTDNDVCNFVIDQPFSECLTCLNSKNSKTDSQIKEEELTLMLYEAQLRIFRLRYAMYNHLYANDMISSPVFQSLSEAVNRGISEGQLILPIKNIYKSWYKQTYLWKVWRKLMLFLLQPSVVAVRPQSEFRSKIYSLATSKVFVLFMIILDVLCAFFYIYTIVNAICHSDSISWPGWFFFCVVFLVEFILKVTAMGFLAYLSYFWNKIDFILLVFTMEHIIEMVSNVTNRTIAIVFYCPNCLRIFKILQLLGIFENFYHKCVLYVDFLFAKKFAHSYEIAKTYAQCDEIVLSRLPSLIDHAKVREIVQPQIENDILKLITEIGSFEVKHECVVASVKSRQLALSTIYCMRENIFLLYKEGWLQEDEYRRFDQNFIGQKQRVKNKVQCLLPINSIGKFAEQVLWLYRNNHIFFYLLPRHIVKEFKAGETIVREGMFLDGIYIIISGFLRVEFEPNIAVIRFLEEYGVLPVVEPIRWRNFIFPLKSVLLNGNSFGEMSLLTERPSDCSIIAEVPTRVIFFDKDSMRSAFELFDHHINGLKQLMWHAKVINLTSSILMSTPIFNCLSQAAIHAMLMRAFVLSIDSFDKLYFTEHVEDAVLIEGAAFDRKTSSTYIAPCYIPRTTRKLMFFKQKGNNENVHFVVPKLLIIPFPNFKLRDLGLRRVSKNTCRLVNKETEMHHFFVEDDSSVEQ